jgi:hypothetical protein
VHPHATYHKLVTSIVNSMRRIKTKIGNKVWNK